VEFRNAVRQGLGSAPRWLSCPARAPPACHRSHLIHERDQSHAFVACEKGGLGALRHPEEDGCHRGSHLPHYLPGRGPSLIFFPPGRKTMLATWKTPTARSTACRLHGHSAGGPFRGLCT